MWAEMAILKAVWKLYAGMAPSIRCFRGNVRVCFAVLISEDRVRKWEAECKTEQPRGLGHSLDQFLERDVRRPEIITKPAVSYLFQPSFPHWTVLALCSSLTFLCYIRNKHFLLTFDGRNRAWRAPERLFWGCRSNLSFETSEHPQVSKADL